MGIVFNLPAPFKKGDAQSDAQFATGRVPLLRGQGGFEDPK